MNKVAFLFHVPSALHRNGKTNISLAVVAHKLLASNHCTVDFPALNEMELTSVKDWERVVELARNEAKEMFNAGKSEPAMWLTSPTPAPYGHSSDLAMDQSEAYAQVHGYAEEQPLYYLAQ